MARDRFIMRQFGQDLTRQRFAQLDPPLVKAEDVPDHALYKDLVFVQRDQFAKREGGDLFYQKRVGGTVAAKAFVGDQLGGDLLCFQLFLGLPVHEGLRLGEEVAEQFVMMISQRVVADGRSDEVTRDHERALVDQLVKRMLAIGAGFTPDHRTRVPTYWLSVAVNALPVALHIALLEIGGKTVHILVIGQDRLRLRSEEIGIPQSYEGHGDGNIRFEGCRPEMHIGRMGALQQGFEMVKAHG